MLKNYLLILVTVFTQFFFSPFIKAQGYFNPNIGDALRLSISGQIYDARSLSMGNAHSVLNDTYSAALLNPATLGLARRLTVNTSIGFNLYNNDATFLNETFPGKKTETALTQAGIVIPLASDTSTNNFVISIGYNRSTDFSRILEFSGFNSTSTSLIQDLTSLNSYIPRQLLLSYSQYDPGTNEYLGDRTIFNGNLHQEGYVLEEGGINFWSFGAAYEYEHNIFFGISFNYNVGNYLSNKEFTESNTMGFYPDSLRTIPNNPLTAGFQSFYIDNINEWVFNGYDVRIGVLYKLSAILSAGVTFKTPSFTSVSDQNYIKGESEFSSSNTVQLDTLIENKFTVQSPFEITLAAAADFWLMTISAEATYIDYTQMKFSNGFDISQRTELNKQIMDTYSQIFNLQAGAEFRLPFTGLSARVGAMYNPYPIANAPKEFDRKYLTTGLGIKSGEGSIEFNVAYVYGFWDELSNDYGTSVQQVYQKIVSQNIVASLTLRL